jgi:hypothetical protein
MSISVVHVSEKKMLEINELYSQDAALLTCMKCSTFGVDILNIENISLSPTPVIYENQNFYF